MLNPFRVLGSSFRDLFDDFLLLIVCNLIWALLAIPIWAVALSLLVMGQGLLAAVAGLLGVLPAGPATAGLFYVAYRITDGRATKVADFFDGLRQHARIGLTLTAIAVAGLALILFNLSFYLTVANILGGLMLGLWLYLLLTWLGLLIYVFPLAFLQERPALRLIARNAALMAVGRPVFTLVTLLLMAVLFVISVYLVVPIAAFTVSLLAVWSTRAARALIEDARRRREAAQEAPSGPPPIEEKGRKGQVRPK